MHTPKRANNAVAPTGNRASNSIDRAQASRFMAEKAAANHETWSFWYHEILVPLWSATVHAAHLAANALRIIAGQGPDVRGKAVEPVGRPKAGASIDVWGRTHKEQNKAVVFHSQVSNMGGYAKRALAAGVNPWQETELTPYQRHALRSGARLQEPQPRIVMATKPSRNPAVPPPPSPVRAPVLPPRPAAPKPARPSPTIAPPVARKPPPVLAPGAGKGISPSLPKQPKPLPVEVAPAKRAGNVAVPSYYQRQLAGYEVRKTGVGEMALDAICKENGWVWSLIGTYDKDGKARTAVIIGTVFEGEAEIGPKFEGGPMQAYNAADAALADLAAYLRDEYGGSR